MSHGDITGAILSHPASATVATVTASTAIANWIGLFGDVLGLVAICASIAVSYIMFKKHKYDLDRLKALDNEDKE